MLFNNLIR